VDRESIHYSQSTIHEKGGITLSVAIRLRRTGTVKKAHWQMVASHKLTKRNGRYLEMLGYYDPGKEPAIIELKTDRVKYWLDQGAIPSQGALNLLKKKGIKVPAR